MFTVIPIFLFACSFADRRGLFGQGFFGVEGPGRISFTNLRPQFFGPVFVPLCEHGLVERRFRIESPQGRMGTYQHGRKLECRFEHARGFLRLAEAFEPQTDEQVHRRLDP